MPLVGPSVRLSHILESYCHPQTVKEGDMAKTSFARPTVFDCRCITPPHGPVFHARYLPSRSRVGANKVGDANISLRASRCIVQCWHPFGSRAIELGRPPQGCVIYTEYTGMVGAGGSTTTTVSNRVPTDHGPSKWPKMGRRFCRKNVFFPVFLYDGGDCRYTKACLSVKRSCGAIELGRPPKVCDIHRRIRVWLTLVAQPCSHRPRAIKMAKDGPAFP